MPQKPSPNKVLHDLSDNGIGAALHYPVSRHLQKAYAGNGQTPGAYPVCEAAAKRILSLPMFPGLDCDRVAAVSDRIATFFLESRQITD